MLSLPAILRERDMSEYSVNVFADYFQFYLQDESASGELEEGDWRIPGAVDRLLALGPGTICVGTARNMTVPVKIDICKQAPLDALDNWDQVNECSISIPSGRFVVYGCTEWIPNALHISVEPGDYRARILYGNLNLTRGNGLEGDDHYLVKLWREPFSDLVILKQRAVVNKAE